MIKRAWCFRGRTRGRHQEQQRRSLDWASARSQDEFADSFLSGQNGKLQCGWRCGRCGGCVLFCAELGVEVADGGEGAWAFACGALVGGGVVVLRELFDDHGHCSVRLEASMDACEGAH